MYRSIDFQINISVFKLNHPVTDIFFASHRIPALDQVKNKIKGERCYCKNAIFAQSKKACAPFRTSLTNELHRVTAKKTLPIPQDLIPPRCGL